MKAHGKGKVFHINAGGTSKVNNFKMILANVSEGVPVLEWKPLTSWPAKPHQHQDRLDAEKAIKSRFA